MKGLLVSKQNHLITRSTALPFHQRAQHTERVLKHPPTAAVKLSVETNLHLRYRFSCGVDSR